MPRNQRQKQTGEGNCSKPEKYQNRITNQRNSLNEKYRQENGNHRSKHHQQNNTREGRENLSY